MPGNMLAIRALLSWCFVASTIKLVTAKNNTCDLSWLFVDIHYRAVDAKPDTYSYGLFIGAGTSSQNQSLWPSITFNETRLASNDFCGAGSPSNCNDPAYGHGHFGGDASSTFSLTPQYSSLDVDPTNSTVNVRYGQDDLNVFTHFFDPSPASRFVVQNHSLTILSNSTSDHDVFFDSGSLGLGPSSTLIKQLKDQGRIDRNVFGMYLGTAYPRAGGTQNGSLVFGGYDAGRLQGDLHKYEQVPVPAENASPFKVHVKQMSLITEDGSSVALVTDDGFDGYISTSQYPMDLPQSVTKTLSDALKASPGQNPENTLQLAQKFNGNLTITLDDGYQITYPSDWISNVSNNTPFSASGLAMNSSNSAMQPLVFGAAFLHHLYMTIDYDNSSFYLADAKVFDNYVQPLSLCPSAMPVPLSKPHFSKFVQSGMIGAIIGGLVGGIGISWLIMYCVRKRLQKKMSNQAIGRMEGGGLVPKKSSLRRKPQLSFFRHRKEPKDVKFADVKHISSSDSDTSSVNGITVTVTSKDQGATPHTYEMNNLKHNQTESRNVAGLSPVSPLTPANVSNDRTITTQVSLPTPDHFSDPYAASPTAPPLYTATPRTANPLLGSHEREYSNFDDNDDSDIPQQHRFTHSRTSSNQSRNRMNLSVNTDTPKDKRTKNIQVAQPTARRKPMPLPLKIVSSGRAEVSDGNSSPVSVRSEMSFGQKKKHSMLRKMFPAS